MPEPIDTTNDCAVCVSAHGVGMLRPPLGPMPKDKALRLAAWLVALAEEKDGEFQAVLDAVRNT
jgi:hypothetical protein